MDRPRRPLVTAAWLWAATAALTSAGRAAVVIPGQPRAELQGVADRVHAFTVLVQARGDRAADARSATGVLVGGRLILTDLDAVTVRRSDGSLAEAPEIEALLDRVGPVPALLVAGDPVLGVAVLQLPDQVPDLPGAAIAPGAQHEGEMLVAVGAHGDKVTAVAIVVETLRPGEDGLPRLHTSPALPAPFRGGPLFDADGRLAGVNVRSEQGSPTAVPSSLLRALLAELPDANGI
jgi:S1-C subfamily serine protease